MNYEVAHFVNPGRIGCGGARGLEAAERLLGEYEVDSTDIEMRQTGGVFAEYF